MDAPLPTRDRAWVYRRAMSPPEVLLWNAIKGRRLAGLHFRRQHPIGRYVLDFYCGAARLAVEVDGQGHGLGHRPQRDERRDAWLLAQGIRTLRIPASVVLDDVDAATGWILTTVEETPPPPSGPPPQGEDPGRPSCSPNPPPLGELAKREGACGS